MTQILGYTTQSLGLCDTATRGSGRREPAGVDRGFAPLGTALSTRRSDDPRAALGLSMLAASTRTHAGSTPHRASWAARCRAPVALDPLATEKLTHSGGSRRRGIDVGEGASPRFPTDESSVAAATAGATTARTLSSSRSISRPGWQRSCRRGGPTRFAVMAPCAGWRDAVVRDRDGLCASCRSPPICRCQAGPSQERAAAKPMATGGSGVGLLLRRHGAPGSGKSAEPGAALREEERRASGPVPLRGRRLPLVGAVAPRVRHRRLPMRSPRCTRRSTFSTSHMPIST